MQNHLTQFAVATTDTATKPSRYGTLYYTHENTPNSH